MPFKCLPIILFILCLCFSIKKAQGQTISASAASGTIFTCIGTVSSSPNLQQFTVSGNGFSSAITAVAPANFEISLSPGTGYVSSLTFPSASTIIYVRSAASASAGNISGKVVLSATGAATQTVAVTGIIDDLPLVNTVANQTVTDGEATAAVNFTGTAQSYSWTNDTPGIGLAASGSGNIASFTAINTGNTPITATITVTPKPAPLLYVSDYGGGVSVVNLNTNAVIHIATGSYTRKTIVSHDGSTVYALDYDKNISIIDAFTNTVLATLNTGLSANNMELTPNGDLLFVTDGAGNKVVVINTLTKTIIATVSAQGYSTASYMSRDGKYFYVLNSVQQTISVINTKTLLVESTITGIVEPFAFVENADNTRLYVTDLHSNTIHVIDEATSSDLAIIAVGVSPSSLTISPDGTRIYCANSSSVSVIDPGTNKIITTISVGQACAGVYITPDGKYLYALCAVDNAVSVINTATNTVIAKVSVAGSTNTGYTRDAVLSPDGNFLYITDDIDKSVQIISTITNTKVGDVNLKQNGYPRISDQSISNGVGCKGAPITFTITVNPKPPELIITASNTSKIYGETLSSGQVGTSFTVIGLKNGETVGSVTLTYDAGGAATDNAGNYAGKIVPSAATGGTFVAGDYKIIYVAGDLTITPALLTITAVNAERNYGTNNPVFKATYSGFVNGQAESVLSKLPTLSTTATLRSAGGEYPIKVSNAAALNYAITYVDGVLTVIPPVALVIPNSFTPNNDGVNDTWVIPALASYPNCTVKIFNRYGTQLYNSTGYSIPWDATFKSKNVPSGVYYYIIDTKTKGIKASGSLTVIR